MVAIAKGGQAGRRGPVPCGRPPVASPGCQGQAHCCSPALLGPLRCWFDCESHCPLPRGNRADEAADHGESRSCALGPWNQPRACCVCVCPVFSLRSPGRPEQAAGAPCVLLLVFRGPAGGFGSGASPSLSPPPGSAVCSVCWGRWAGPQTRPRGLWPVWLPSLGMPLVGGAGMLLKTAWKLLPEPRTFGWAGSLGSGVPVPGPGGSPGVQTCRRLLGCL